MSAQFFIFLAFSLLYAAYTANIVSILQSPSKSIRTMEDLYNSKLTLWMEDAAFIKFYALNSKKPLNVKIYNEKLIKNGRNPYLTPAKGVSFVRKGLNG